MMGPKKINYNKTILSTNIQRNNQSRKECSTSLSLYLYSCCKFSITEGK